MNPPKTPETRRAQAAGNTSAKGRKARQASPWNKGPMCEGQKAMAAFKRYQANGKK